LITKVSDVSTRIVQHFTPTPVSKPKAVKEGDSEDGASADARQGKAPATTCASVSASLIAASQIADGSLYSDGLVLPPDWGGDVYSSKELLDLRFSRTFLVQPGDNLKVAARLIDLLRGHVKIMGGEDVKENPENIDLIRIQGLNGILGRACQVLSYATMLQHVNLVVS